MTHIELQNAEEGGTKWKGDAQSHLCSHFDEQMQGLCLTQQMSELFVGRYLAEAVVSLIEPEQLKSLLSFNVPLNPLASLLDVGGLLDGKYTR